MRRSSKDICLRFFEKVRKLNLDSGGCWIWIGLKNKKGYGRFSVSRSIGMLLAHRLSWEIHRGSIPSGMCILHRCDVPACVNPEHLFLGTRQDNNQDMIKKGRARFVAWMFIKPEHRVRGENAKSAKLTEAEVVLIRTEYAKGDTSFVKLGKKYGVGKTQIESIVKRRKWVHVR